MADNFETIRRHARELRGGVAAADDEAGRDVLQRALKNVVSSFNCSLLMIHYSVAPTVRLIDRTLMYTCGTIWTTLKLPR